MIHHRATEDAEAGDNVLTHEIIGSAMEVHRHLGPGLLESVYETALGYELEIRGFRIQRQVLVPVVYKGLNLKTGIRLDLCVEDRVIVEVKSVDHLHEVHRAQLLTSETDGAPHWPALQLQREVHPGRNKTYAERLRKTSDARSLCGESVPDSRLEPQAAKS